MNTRLAMPLLAAVALTAAPAFAQDAATPPETSSAADVEAAAGGDSITIGAGIGIVPDYEGSNETRIAPVPGAIGSIGGFSFSLAGNRLSVDLIPNNPGPTWDIQAGPVGIVNFNRSSREGIDDARVAALAELDTAIELGGYLGIGKTGVITSDFDKLSISVSYRHDVAGVHDSGIWQPSINYLTPLSRKAAVGLFASAEHVEQGYARTYFSISPTESIASGLPVYNAEDGWKSWTVGLLGTVAVSGDLLQGFKIVAGGTYKRLINDFGDSPITSIAGSKDQWIGAVGLAYTF